MIRLFVALTPMLFLISLTACRSAPRYSPTETGHKMAESLRSGDTETADELFEEIRHSKRHRNGSYPVVFAAGSRAYERGDFLVAASHFRFLVDHYNNTEGAADSLAFSLFLARAEAERTTPSLQNAIRDAVSLARDRRGTSPIWIDLIEAQNLVDEGNSRQAGPLYASFRSRWDGEPVALRPYVDDLGHAIAQK